MMIWWDMSPLLIFGCVSKKICLTMGAGGTQFWHTVPMYIHRQIPSYPPTDIHTYAQTSTDTVYDEIGVGVQPTSRALECIRILPNQSKQVGKVWKILCGDCHHWKSTIPPKMICSGFSISKDVRCNPDGCPCWSRISISFDMLKSLRRASSLLLFKTIKPKTPKLWNHKP